MIERQILDTVVAAQRRVGYFENALSEGTDFLNQHYRIEATLYRGQSGFVYQGVHRLTGKRVAIKEFFPQVTIVEGDVTLTLQRRTGTPYVAIAHFSEQHFDIFEQVKARFINEARTMQFLNQKPWTVPLLDVFEANGTVYLVLEYMIEPTLAECMSHLQALNNKQAQGWLNAQIFDAIASSLAINIEALHDAHLLHRDIKPANLFITEKGVVLGDFGIARQGADEGLEGTLVYSVQYAAPEQMHRGARQGTWTDWYAYGRILERFSGLMPESERRHARFAKPELIEALTAFDIEKRVQRYSDIQCILSRQASKGPQRRPRYLLVAVSVIVLTGSLFALTWSRQGSDMRDEFSSTAPTAVLGQQTPSTQGLAIQSTSNKTTVEETTEATTTPVKVAEVSNVLTLVPTKSEPAATHQGPTKSEPAATPQATHQATPQATTKQTAAPTTTAPLTTAEVVDPSGYEALPMALKVLSNEQWQIEIMTQPEGKYRYGEPIQVRWSAHEDLAPYGVCVSITDLTSWMTVSRRVPVDQQSLDLTTFGLKPGKYRVYFCANVAPVVIRPTTYKDIIVVGEGKLMKAPDLTAMPKSFKLGNDAVMAWPGLQQAKSYRLTISRIKPTQVLIGKYQLRADQTSLRLGDYIKSPGTYNISLAGDDGQVQGLTATKAVVVAGADALVPPALNLTHHQYFKLGSGRVITWQPVSGAESYQLSLYHYGYSETIFIEKDMGKATQFDFSGMALKAGSYLVVLTYKDSSGNKSLEDEAIIDVAGQ